MQLLLLCCLFSTLHARQRAISKTSTKTKVLIGTSVALIAGGALIAKYGLPSNKKNDTETSATGNPSSSTTTAGASTASSAFAEKVTPTTTHSAEIPVPDTTQSSKAPSSTPQSDITPYYSQSNIENILEQCKIKDVYVTPITLIAGAINQYKSHPFPLNKGLYAACEIEYNNSIIVLHTSSFLLTEKPSNHATLTQDIIKLYRQHLEFALRKSDKSPFIENNNAFWNNKFEEIKATYETISKPDTFVADVLMLICKFNLKQIQTAVSDTDRSKINSAS